MAFFICENEALAAEQTALLKALIHTHDLGPGPWRLFCQPGLGGFMQITLMVMDITSLTNDT